MWVQSLSEIVNLCQIYVRACSSTFFCVVFNGGWIGGEIKLQVLSVFASKRHHRNDRLPLRWRLSPEHWTRVILFILVVTLQSLE